MKQNENDILFDDAAILADQLCVPAEDLAPNCDCTSYTSSMTEESNSYDWTNNIR